MKAATLFNKILSVSISSAKIIFTGCELNDEHVIYKLHSTYNKYQLKVYQHEKL